jgi:cell division protein FtsB
MNLIQQTTPMPATRQTPATRTSQSGRRARPGAADARDRRQRTITWILLAAVGILLVNALVGENGYLATVQARQEEALLAHAVAGLRIENQNLKAERERLQNDPVAIEEAARRDLGMLRPGEAVVVIDTAPAVPETPAPPATR